MHTERTFIAIKPEGIQRRLIGEIIGKFEKKGLKLVAAKLTSPSVEKVEEHYQADEEWFESSGNRTLDNYKAKGIDPGMTARELAIRTRKRCIDHLANRTIFAMVWEGSHAVQVGRKLAGHTNPLAAESGTVRGDFSIESYEMADGHERSILNMLHASGAVEEAEREIALWFDKDEVLDYDMVDQQIILSNDWGKVKQKK